MNSKGRKEAYDRLEFLIRQNLGPDCVALEDIANLKADEERVVAEADGLFLKGNPSILKVPTMQTEFYPDEKKFVLNVHVTIREDAQG